MANIGETISEPFELPETRPVEAPPSTVTEPGVTVPDPVTAPERTPERVNEPVPAGFDYDPLDYYLAVKGDDPGLDNY